jgi:hypothetical protein
MRILTLTAVLVSGCASNANLAAQSDGRTTTAFSKKADVYLSGADWAEGTYTFEVTDRHGNTLSTDQENCRRFHVDVNGMITAVLGGACGHPWANDRVRHGALTIQLAPFEDSRDGRYSLWVMTDDIDIAYDAFRVQSQP